MSGANQRSVDFKTVVAGGLVALALWSAGAWTWQTYGWSSLFVAAGVWLVANLVYLLKHWYDGRKGLNQWPDPYGRYYSEWLDLPQGAGNYYDWLERKMDHREPWKTWAELDRQTRG